MSKSYDFLYETTVDTPDEWLDGPDYDDKYMQNVINLDASYIEEAENYFADQELSDGITILSMKDYEENVEYAS